MQRKLTPEQRERRNQRNRAYKARKKAERAVYPPITQVSEEVEFINDFIKSTRINSNVRKVSRELRTRGLNVPPNLREVLFFLRGGTSRSARKGSHVANARQSVDENKEYHSKRLANGNGVGEELNPRLRKVCAFWAYALFNY